MSGTINNTGGTGSSNEKYSPNAFCEACGGPTHIEVIGVKSYHVCDDVTCMWMSSTSVYFSHKRATPTLAELTVLESTTMGLLHSAM